MANKGIQLYDSDNNKLYPNPFPVGAIYMSVDSRNPSQIFGGKWEQIKDRFLLAAGSTYKAGNTGGSATHKLTTNEIPSHSHRTGILGNVSYNPGTNMGQGGNSAGVLFDQNAGVLTTAVGGSAAHNNMPPYLVVYIWKRVS